MRLYDRFINAIAGIAGLLIGGICLLIVYDVIARNLGWQPPTSTVALTEYALLYITMAAAPWLVRERGHIVVEVFHQRLPANAQRVLKALIPALCSVVSALIAVLAALLAIEAWQRGEVEIRSLDAPRWLLFLPVAIGFSLMAIEFARILVSRGSVFPGQANGESGMRGF